jgi:nitroreductase
MSESMVSEALRTRRSGRLYDEARTLTVTEVRSLIEAARWAPSAGNGQPWRFVVGLRGDAHWERLLPLLHDGNRTWAQHASALILTCALTSRTTPDGRTVHNGSALHDAGMANMSIAVEATTRGLMLRMMGGYDRDAARALVAGAHAGIEPVTMMAVGYAGAGESLPEDVRSRDAAPRLRLPIDELLIAKID